MNCVRPRPPVLVRLHAPVCLLAAALAAGGCTQVLSFEPRWVAGDLHVHASGASNDTDGESLPEDIAEVARARGLDFVVLTDHSNSAGSMHCEDVEDCPNLGPEFTHAERAAELSDDGFLMAVGSEISPLGTGHVGCLPPEGGFAWEGAFVDRPEGEVAGTDALQACQQQGGFAVVNHPFAQASWIRWDWTSTAWDGVEVWNGTLRWDPADRSALAAWECSVARGQRVTPIASSDNHRARMEPPGGALDPVLGMPRTSVALLDETALSWAAVRRGLLAGRVVLHEEDTWLEATDLTWSQRGERWTIAGVAPRPSRVELRWLPELGERVVDGEVVQEAGCEPADGEAVGPLHEVWWSEQVGGEFELTTDELEHDPDEVGSRYLALVPLEPDLSMDGGVALTGVLETGVVR